MKPIDVVIIGGGIAGLWTLAVLRQRGYSALLLEKSALGARQTLASQGIIHGGTKYALTGHLSGAAQAIAEMPPRWLVALRGEGEVDLRSAKVLSNHQYLWTNDAVGGKLTAFFAGKVMRNRMTRLATGAFPDFLPRNFRGHCYALEEPVIDVVSLLATFATQYADCVITHADWQEDCGVLRVNGMRYQPTQWVYTAGEANGELSVCPQQLRPLRMTALRVPADAPDIYGHCLGLSDKPKVTITTHAYDYRQPSLGKVYWIGGEPAEHGVTRNHEAQVGVVRALLQETAPWLDSHWVTDDARYITVLINRAEGKNHGKRPDLPIIIQRDNRLTIWPTKLAFAPLVADEVADKLLSPRYPQPSMINSASIEIAPYLWTQSLSV